MKVGFGLKKVDKLRMGTRLSTFYLVDTLINIISGYKKPYIPECVQSQEAGI